LGVDDSLLFPASLVGPAFDPPAASDELDSEGFGASFFAG
jgi:hypothetical protein